MRFPFVISIITFAACTPANNPTETTRPPVNARHVAAVATSKPERGFIGVIVAHESIDVVPKASGRLKEITVRLGDKVARDAVVAKLDAEAARQDLRMAEASLRAAQVDVDKATVEAAQAHERAHRREPEAAEGKHLFSQEELSDARYQDKLAAQRVMAARAAVAEKSARVKQLRSALDDLDLRAPFDGTVSARYVDAGGVVGPTTPILKLINPDDLWVRFAIPEDRAASVAPGRRLRVAVETMTDVGAVVERVAPEVDTASRMIIAEAKLDVPAEWKTRIRSGLAARAFPDAASSERAPASAGAQR